MSVKDQWMKIKQNWLIIVIIAIAFVFVFAGSGVIRSGGSMLSNSYSKGMADYAIGGGYASPEASYSSSSYRGGSYMPTPIYDNGFAPEVKARKIVKTASLGVQTEYGRFAEGNDKIEMIVKSTDSFLLSNNVNTYNQNEKNEYKSGYYTIKVEVDKYDAVLAQLKDVGKVQSLTESGDDVTGQYISLEKELEIANDKLKMYQKMYADATLMEDKINLVDRITSQEWTIKYLEEQIANMDNRIDYTTISVSLTEKQRTYSNIVFVKFSELINNLVRSTSGLLKFLFIILPWAVGLTIIIVLVRLVRRKQ